MRIVVADDHSAGRGGNVTLDAPCVALDSPERMSDYRVEKVRRRVAITLANGIPLAGDIFLQVAARFREGPEEPIDTLNGDEPFLPLVEPSGEVTLIQKAHIVTVTTRREPDEPAPAVPGMDVEFTLSDGTILAGSIYPELRADRPRLVDFLNDPSRRFIALVTPGEVLAVNREHLAFARPGA